MIRFSPTSGTTSASAVLAANRFAGYVHVAAITKGGEIEVYVDGARSASPLVLAPGSVVVAPVVIGSSRSGAGSFRGAIDEVAIYDYPLDADQIKRHIAAADPRDAGP